MKKILILGAGLVAPPVVGYLSMQPDMEVTLCDQDESRAESLINSNPSCRARRLDVADTARLNAAVAASDIVISLLPWTFHPKIASLCLEFGKHLVTASYAKAEMREFHERARQRGLLFLNEMGVDPGLDHMLIMRAVNGIRKEGGKIEGLLSCCGGLPALECNNNPLGYKFSWSPEGALLAATNPGRYLADGSVVEVPGKTLFRHYRFIDIPGVGVLEVYVNRDALPYLKLYGIEDARSIFRGTLRYPGHCETWAHFVRLGLLNRKNMFDFSKQTPRDVLCRLVGGDNGNLMNALAGHLEIPVQSLTPKKLQWLGLLDDRKLPLSKASAFDMFAHILKEKLTYENDEIDLLAQHHEITALYDNGRREMTSSSLTELGIRGGDTAMSRTVGLPVAIGVKLMAEGKIPLSGVHIPVLPEIYEPVLKELEAMGITSEERNISLS